VGKARVIRHGMALFMVLISCDLSAFADLCPVPSSSHVTIQAAVDDPACTEIELAAGAFIESVVIPRDLVLRGASTTATVIEGQVTVQGGSTQAHIEDLTIDGSAAGVGGTLDQALLVGGGARIAGSGLVVLNAATDLHPIFTDGFESGSTSAWSGTSPS